MDEPRLSDVVVAHRVAYTCNFPDKKIFIQNHPPISIEEEVSVLRDLQDARRELRDLCAMVHFFSNPPESDDIEPTKLVQFAQDIAARYGWSF